MLVKIILKTYQDYLKLDLIKNNVNDIQYEYKLIRYTLNENSEIAKAVARNIYTIYMSNAYNMNNSLYLSSADLEHNYEDKTVTDVTNIVKYYDYIIDNTIQDDNKIYVYIIHAINTSNNAEYVTDPAVGYKQLPIKTFGVFTNPIIIPYFLKHRGVAELNVVNSFFYTISNSIYYLNRYIDKEYIGIDDILNTMNNNNIEIMDKVEQLIQTIKLYSNDKNIDDILKNLIGFVIQLGQ